MIDKQAALHHIDYVLNMMGNVDSQEGGRDRWTAEQDMLLEAAFERLCPRESAYWAKLYGHGAPPLLLPEKVGVLMALRAAYENGWLQTFTELVHQGLLADFLGMAEQLLSEGFKDAAAVYAGGVLEDHLRNLCTKSKIEVAFKDKNGHDQPKKVSKLNDDLKASGVYGTNEHKQVTAWAGIRNSAAHGKYAEYSADQVGLLVDGIRLFITRYPA